MPVKSILSRLLNQPRAKKKQEYGSVQGAIKKFRVSALRGSTNQRIWHFLIEPSPRAAVAWGAAFVIIVLLEIWASKLFLMPSLMLFQDQLFSASTTMWEVEVGLAGAALPILIFIIEVSKDEVRSASKTSRVLIKETGIFPITIVSILIAIKMGINLHFMTLYSVCRSINAYLFIATALMIIFAYL